MRPIIDALSLGASDPTMPSIGHVGVIWDRMNVQVDEVEEDL